MIFLRSNYEKDRVLITEKQVSMAKIEFLV